MKKQLKRTVQCAKCPWKKEVNPHDIPDGYSEEKHKALADTIAEPGVMPEGNKRKAMACHYSKPAEGMHCVGWLNHQLGVGNNIGLRLSMMNVSNAGEITVVGEQHEAFEDTLPKNTEKHDYSR